MAQLNIGIIVGTTRQGRFGRKAAEWIAAQGGGHPAMRFEIVDLADYPLPFFYEEGAPKYTPSADPVARRWSDKLAGFDGFIFVTAEYNHSVSATLKNAIDFAYPELVRKPAAYLGYGGVGGARAVEHLRLICIELEMAALRTGVHIAGGDFMLVRQPDHEIDEVAHLAGAAKAMLSELEWWADVLKKGRDIR